MRTKDQLLRRLCVLCHCPMYKGEGNSAWPMSYGICCDDCLESYVFMAQRSVLMEPLEYTETMQ